MTTADNTARVGSEMSRHRRVSRIEPDTLKARPLADFWLEADGTVRVEWAGSGAGGEMFRQEIEDSGIAVAAGIYRPSDGADFFDNLALAFSQSSFIEVTEEGVDGMTKANKKSKKSKLKKEPKFAEVKPLYVTIRNADGTKVDIE